MNTGEVLSEGSSVRGGDPPPRQFFCQMHFSNHGNEAWKAKSVFSLCMSPWLTISLYLNIFTQDGAVESAWQSTSSDLSLRCQRSWFNSQSYYFLIVCQCGRHLISLSLSFFTCEMGQGYNTELIRGLCELNELVRMKPLALLLKQASDSVNVN